MKNKIIRAVSLALALIFLFAAGTGCTKAETPMSSATKQRAEELMNQFAEELKILYYPDKDDADALAENEITVSTKTETRNFDFIRVFAENAAAKKNTSVTFANTATAFVVTKLVFEGDYGYYMRYQHDPSDDGTTFAISTKMMKSVVLTENGDAGSAELVVNGEKAKLATFSFKNIV